MFGYGRGGRGKGAGKGSFHSRSPVEHSASMHVPEGAGGLIIGSKGSNIKELQAIPGVGYVELRGTSVEIGGTRLAVEEVQMRIQSKLNSFLAKRPRSATKLQVDTEGSTDALCFALASARDSVVDLSGYHAGREYFHLSPTQAVDELAARFGMLQLASQPQTGHCIHVPMNSEEMRAGFSDFLDIIADIPRDKVIEVQMRLGVLAFHMLSEAARSSHAPQHFRTLQPHVDFKTQFSCQLKFTLDTIEAVLAREGYELMEQSCCTVVHFVSLAAGEGASYAVVFVEPSEGQKGDPRKDAAKRQELERIAQCRSAEEVLEVSAGASKAVIKKAYFKKSIMVHPDKNAYHGATEAMKVLGSAQESLSTGKAMGLRPPLFEVGGAPEELPQIAEFLTAKVPQLQEEVVRLRGRLGYRVAVTSKGETDKPAARDFLEQAWREGAIVAGGRLRADDHYSIESVRFKDKSCYSNGSLTVQLDVVKQKTLENAGNFQTCPEMTLLSPALDEAVASLQACTGGPAHRAKALELYTELLDAAHALAMKLN